LAVMLIGRLGRTGICCLSSLRWTGTAAARACCSLIAPRVTQLILVGTFVCCCSRSMLDGGSRTSAAAATLRCCCRPRSLPDDGCFSAFTPAAAAALAPCLTMAASALPLSLYLMAAALAGAWRSLHAFLCCYHPRSVRGGSCLRLVVVLADRPLRASAGLADVCCRYSAHLLDGGGRSSRSLLDGGLRIPLRPLPLSPAGR
jgi:hypothetical protein